MCKRVRFSRMRTVLPTHGWIHQVFAKIRFIQFTRHKLNSHFWANHASLLITIVARSTILALNQRDHAELHECMTCATTNGIHVDQEL